MSFIFYAAGLTPAYSMPYKSSNFLRNMIIFVGNARHAPVNSRTITFYIMSMIITVCVVALVVILVLWGISVQNKLVKADELSKNALRQINVQQMSRYDAIKALVKLTREYSAHESDTLKGVIEARKVTSSPSPTVADIQRNEQNLRAITAQISAVAEQYPDLKANQVYLQTMNDIKGYEENVRLSRMTFNDTVTKFNDLARMFPGSIVAGMLGFPPKEYLAEEASKADFPDF